MNYTADQEKSFLYYMGDKQDALVRALNEIENVFDEDGNPTEEFTDLSNKIMDLVGSAPEKAMTAGSMILEIGADIDSIKAAEARLKGMRQRKEKEQAALMTALADFMDRFNIEKTAGMVRLSFRKSQAVEITCEEALPRQFMRVKYEPDKTLISKALKAGEEVPGAALVNNRSLQVK